MRALVKSDMKYMKRDPMAYGMVMMPIAMTVVYKLGMHYVAVLRPYNQLIQYVFVTMASLFTGIILGLRMLDEKDEHLLPFYAVSPLGLGGYYRYRSVVCSVGVIIVSSIVSIGTDVRGELMVPILIYAVLLGELAMLAMSCLAQNKIQGMVMAKAMGVLVLLPCIRLLGENRLDSILRLLPWDYLYHIVINQKIEWQIYLIYLAAIGIAQYYLVQKAKVSV